MLLSACVTKPENIAATYNDSSIYNHLPCDALCSEFVSAKAEYESWAQK